jgi:F420-non-reducing hydrogenase iron-sulfur subunit
LRLEWISAAEGDKVRQVVNEMVDKLKVLGPLGLPGRFGDWDKEMEHLEHAAQASAAQEPPCPVHAQST